MKSTILLTLAIFLVSVPAPDSKFISEVSAGFLLPREQSALLAAQKETTSETTSNRKNEAGTPADTKRTPTTP